MTDTPPMDQESRPAGPAREKRGKGVLWALLAVVVAFVAGFGWQWYEANTVRADLEATRQELQVERLRVRLGQAALAAQAGDFESARQHMSTLFGEIQERLDALPADVERVGRDFLAMRDDVITGLSRANPEYAGVLYGMLEQFGNAVDGATPSMPAAPMGGQPDTGGGEADTPDTPGAAVPGDTMAPTGQGGP